MYFQESKFWILSVMLFYMCNIPKSLLEIEAVLDIVMERYEYYTSKAAEYDIPTDYDVLGHFIMCLVASKSPLLYEIIMSGETAFFIDKLVTLNGKEAVKELNCAIIFLNSLDEIRGDSSMSSKLQQHRTLLKNVMKTVECKANHIFGTNHSKACYKYEIIVPFTFPLKLVATRKIEIVKGKAKVPCGLWNDLLIEIFKLFLEFEIEFLKKFDLLQYIIYKSEDDRIRNIIEKLIKKITGMTYVNGAISANDIDNEFEYFPPCMSNLHKILRQTHRLSYKSRYQYTLFMKDIGLPAQENVSFWKNEYSKPHNASSCTHYWQENVSRYEYQILHMYGLIGTTTLKTSHSCEKFIGKLSLRMDGGCPFVHFSEDVLMKSFLKDFFEADVECIITEKQRNRPQKACSLYLLYKSNALQSLGKQMIPEILSPLHYYNHAKGLALLLGGNKLEEPQCHITSCA